MTGDNERELSWNRVQCLNVTDDDSELWTFRTESLNFVAVLSFSSGIVDTSDRFGEQMSQQQCIGNETEYDDDDSGNPIWGGIGQVTLAECMEHCQNDTDSYGRPCVAIEWSDDGQE